MALTEAQMDELIPHIQKIISTKLSPDEIKAMISVADTMIDTALENSGYTTSHVNHIRIWLTAHFICIREPKTASETAIGGVNVQYEGMTGMEGLKHTRYGTQVLMLDYKGVLRRAGEAGKPSPQFEVLEDD